MVRCTKCGTENKEDAFYCTQCGEPLREGVPRRMPVRRSEEEMCFGEGRRIFWPILIGIIIVLWGIGMLINFSIWPIIVIVIGLFIIFRVLYYYRRNQSKS